MILKMVIIRIIHIIAVMCIMTYMHIIAMISIISDCFLVGWLESVGSRVVYELDYKKAEKAYPLPQSHSEYPGQASLGARR